MGTGAKRRESTRRVAPRGVNGVNQNCEPMNKNRIEGRRGAMSWHNTAKSSGMPVEVNSAVVQWSNVSLPGEWERSGHRASGGWPREG